eukprot:CAMPEP_0118926600 /NCGR_PEP_ID=MMETSP1169-20130426/4249_1 /TAXON_ID=36882 /ORGANISM="Pyramimonas obovata, Strain CCMP722" /LENGTH=177 /DNA_ID=CAMNT_0006868179 /DNA_START=308 /DNA_END=838 /DNA_ORIENTATION=-
MPHLPNDSCDLYRVIENGELWSIPPHLALLLLCETAGGSVAWRGCRLGELLFDQRGNGRWVVVVRGHVDPRVVPVAAEPCQLAGGVLPGGLLERGQEPREVLLERGSRVQVRLQVLHCLPVSDRAGRGGGAWPEPHLQQALGLEEHAARHHLLAPGIDPTVQGRSRAVQEEAAEVQA